MIRVVGVALMAVATLAGCHNRQLKDCGQLPDDTAVGNAGCLLVSDNRLMMVQQQLDGSWATPGGTAEPGERAACTAWRETREETGLTVKVIKPLQILDNGFHVYHCTVLDNVAVTAVDTLEVADQQWLDGEQRAKVVWRFPAQRQIMENLFQELTAAEK